MLDRTIASWEKVNPSGTSIMFGGDLISKAKRLSITRTVWVNVVSASANVEFTRRRFIRDFGAQRNPSSTIRSQSQNNAGNAWWGGGGGVIVCQITFILSPGRALTTGAASKPIKFARHNPLSVPTLVERKAKAICRFTSVKVFGRPACYGLVMRNAGESIPLKM